MTNKTLLTMLPYQISKEKSNKQNGGGGGGGGGKKTN